MDYTIEPLKIDWLNEKPMEVVGAYMKELRKKNNHTLQDVASELRVSIAAIGKREKSCSYRELLRTAQAMGWEVEEALENLVGLRMTYTVKRNSDGAIMSGVQSDVDRRAILVETPEGKVAIINLNTCETVYVFK